MTDLYDRAEELNATFEVLTADIRHLCPLLGERLPAFDVSELEQVHRRSYIRAVFALIEALTEQYKQLLLDLEECRMITLADDVRKDLPETQRFLPLERKISIIYRAAEDAFGRCLHVSFEDPRWAAFQGAIKVRNRITHPKCSSACYVDEDDLTPVDQGHDWFRDLHNEFITVANAHKKQHGWW